ncbi:MAG: hypothetical protein H7246_20630 [Phycisphaerae bacterium]|nr:hypothetical protein [Saprospiraceae bacterium]
MNSDLKKTPDQGREHSDQMAFLEHEVRSAHRRLTAAKIIVSLLLIACSSLSALLAYRASVSYLKNSVESTNMQMTENKLALQVFEEKLAFLQRNSDAKHYDVDGKLNVLQLDSKTQFAQLEGKVRSGTNLFAEGFTNFLRSWSHPADLPVTFSNIIALISISSATNAEWAEIIVNNGLATNQFETAEFQMWFSNLTSRLISSRLTDGQDTKLLEFQNKTLTSFFNNLDASNSQPFSEIRSNYQVVLSLKTDFEVFSAKTRQSISNVISSCPFCSTNPAVGSP